MSSEKTGVIQEKITDGLHSAFDSIIETRSKFFKDHPEKINKNVDSIIKSYTRNNAMISGGSSLIPGPWGMLAVTPELVIVIKNQVQMIYDIGQALGQEEKITKELLLGIFFAAAGTGAGGLLTVQGGKVLVRRASLRVIQKIIAMLGGRITQQALKSAISKWLPVVGAAAMAAWTGYMTRNIGRKAEEIFKLDIHDDPSTEDIEIES
ncbi:hypothetical protein ACFX58_15625 [Sphingomonas sp. NCPPB 2930]